MTKKLASFSQSKEILGVLLFAAIIAFPITNDLLGFINKPAPFGVAQVPNNLNLSFKSFFSGRYQKIASELAKKRSGLWSPLTKLNNQILYSVFTQVSAFHNPSAVLGNGNKLIQPMYFSAHNNKAKFDKQKFRKRLERIKRIHDHQSKRNKSLFVLITPNNLFVNPEVVPSRYTNPGRDKKQSSYEKALSILDNKSVEYIDTVKELKESRTNYPFSFWGPSASHWNDVGSCLALNQILLKTNNQPINCNDYKLEPARSVDRDLYEIANLIFAPSLDVKMPYVSSAQRREKPVFNKVILVGTSYLFSLHEQFLRWNLAKEVEHLFYYRQIKRNSERGFRNLDKRKYDFKDTLNADLILIDAPSHAPAALGYKFVEDLHTYMFPAKKGAEDRDDERSS